MITELLKSKLCFGDDFGLLCPQVDEQLQSLLLPTMFITNVRVFASYAKRYIDDRVYRVIGERSGTPKHLELSSMSLLPYVDGLLNCRFVIFVVARLLGCEINLDHIFSVNESTNKCFTKIMCTNKLVIRDVGTQFTIHTLNKSGCERVLFLFTLLPQKKSILDHFRWVIFGGGLRSIPNPKSSSPPPLFPIPTSYSLGVLGRKRNAPPSLNVPLYTLVMAR